MSTLERPDSSCAQSIDPESPSLDLANDVFAREGIHDVCNHGSLSELFYSGAFADLFVVKKLVGRILKDIYYGLCELGFFHAPGGFSCLSAFFVAFVLAFASCHTGTKLLLCKDNNMQEISSALSHGAGSCLRVHLSPATLAV
jgi:hypothetical protein